MKKIIYQIIAKHRDKQGTSKRLLHIEDLEKEVVCRYGSPSNYEKAGGYKQLHEEVLFLHEQGVLQRLAKPVSNWKKPPLDGTYWIMPLYVQNEWDKVSIAKSMSYLNIGYYLQHKKHQTVVEWEKINALCEFLMEKEHHSIVAREERSLMLFKNIQLPEGMETEKYLASKEGQLLLNRLHITPEDLRFYVVREPFHYWVNRHHSDAGSEEVLVIEGLSSYDTLKTILSKGGPWIFGPIPRYLIWGEGYRIINTLDYLHEIGKDPVKLNIRYAGDIDYEGFNIYLELKQKYKNLNISLAQHFYRFLIDFMDEYSSIIQSDQRVVNGHLSLLQQEFHDDEMTFLGIKRLWKDRKRIPQECINMDTIKRWEVTMNGKSDEASI